MYDMKKIIDSVKQTLSFSWHKLLVYSFVLAMCFEAMGVFSLVFLDPAQPVTPWPWTWVMVAEAGHPGVAVTALVLTLLTLFISVNYLRAGIYRWIAMMALVLVGMVLFGTELGLVVFTLWTGATPMPELWQVVALYEQLALYPSEFHPLLLSLLAGNGATIGAMLWYALNQRAPEQSVLGDAHFARAPEIQKAGFFEEEGVIVGKAWGKPLKAGGFEHVLVFSPAGSGKTSAIAVPNLLSWEQSCVVNDTKYELFELTSRYRQQTFQNAVFCWAPTRLDGRSHRYNPLKFISRDPYKRISEIQLMGHVLIPNGQGEPIWYQSARELFLALVLYLLDTQAHKTTFAELYNVSKQHHFNQWLEKQVVDTTHYDAEFYRNASSYLNTAEKTRASILKTFTGYLEIFANPIINAATADSDFDLRDLRKTKMTIYIGFPDNEKEMISPLLTIFWQQLIGFMTEKLPDEKKEPYALLCLMDEFSALGRLVNLKNSLKILRGYHVRVLIIIQYLAQTLELYSKAEAESFKNIKTKISFALDSHEDAEYVSKLLGMQTKKITTHSFTSHSQSSSASTNHQLQSVPLMRPEEIQRMKDTKAIIMRTGHPPVMAQQYRWYQQPSLKHLPCGTVDVPYQTPLITPFERSSKETLAEASLSEKEKQLLQESEQAQLLLQKEMQKMQIQAQFLAVAMKEVMESNKSE